IKMLPELAGKVAEPMANIEKLSIVDTGNGEGAARLSNYVTSLMATAPTMLENVTGINVNEIIRKFTNTEQQPGNMKQVDKVTDPLFKEVLEQDNKPNNE